MRKYEAFYIVDPGLKKADVQKIADRFKDVVENNGGTVQSAGLWEKRKLAFEIEDLREGNYILMEFESDSTVPNELKRQMRNSDDIVRFRVFLIEE